MAQLKRIMISLPATLLQEVDGIVREEKRNRSEFIRDAMRRYLEDRRRAELRERLREGYRRMGRLNMEFAEEAIAIDEEALEHYEAYLAESDSLDDH